ncbi:hypothetical protein [Romboutsia sp.]|uniref:hypothetical protein n=1 Tax=Romboutsia sp. TaxID=1965302 RepID=UPI002C547D45|nr:hypothetical protein [Romboutsia sp.]HSQ87398.1 hypothetical protein [Romboutsia sp.]
MDRLLGILLVVAMTICMISFDIFWSSNQLIFVALSVLGIISSLLMLLFNNKKYLGKFKK